MRILLAGPIPHNNKSGGVAVFTKNLALELCNKKYSLRVISSFNGNINNRIKIFSYYHVFHVLRQFKPTVIISSLGFSGLFLFVSSKIIKIHLLHGFTNFRDYSFIKVFLMYLFDNFVRCRFNYVLANSKFTKFINEEIFGIRVNGLFRIGLNDLYVTEVKRLSYIHKNNSILYVGRMVNAKNIKLIYDAFCKISDGNEHLNFIGYGPESSWLLNKSKKNSNVSFLGFIQNKNTLDYYKRSKVFISLNPSEPYGITFLEALLNDDFIIAPDTGGQIDLLKLFPKRCRLVDVNNVNDIMSAIKYGLKVNLDPFLKKYKNISKFTYEKTWADIKHVIEQ